MTKILLCHILVTEGRRKLKLGEAIRSEVISLHICQNFLRKTSKKLRLKCPFYKLHNEQRLFSDGAADDADFRNLLIKRSTPKQDRFGIESESKWIGF